MTVDGLSTYVLGMSCFNVRPLPVVYPTAGVGGVAHVACACLCLHLHLVPGLAIMVHGQGCRMQALCSVLCALLQCSRFESSSVAHG